jgi:hypothetical protein
MYQQSSKGDWSGPALLKAEVSGPFIESDESLRNEWSP